MKTKYYILRSLINATGEFGVGHRLGGSLIERVSRHCNDGVESNDTVVNVQRPKGKSIALI